MSARRAWNLTWIGPELPQTFLLTSLFDSLDACSMVDAFVVWNSKKERINQNLFRFTLTRNQIKSQKDGASWFQKDDALKRVVEDIHWRVHSVANTSFIDVQTVSGMSHLPIGPGAQCPDVDSKYCFRFFELTIHDRNILSIRSDKESIVGACLMLVWYVGVRFSTSRVTKLYHISQ